MNPATGMPIYKYHWEDKLSEEDKYLIRICRYGSHPGTVTTLIRLLDEIEATQGGQLALQGVEAPPKQEKR